MFDGGNRLRFCFWLCVHWLAQVAPGSVSPASCLEEKQNIDEKKRALISTAALIRTKFPTEQSTSLKALWSRGGGL
jgi:hypothetical protein